ncbi:MAG: Ig-like domain-containing protein, partial [Planctomycetota bacterium]|nr:Ig-like domain-containing protein [Planctomycetota bacterium]
MATLSFNGNAQTDGFALITVTVTDGGFDNDLSTTGDNLSYSRTLVVLSGSNVNPLPMVTINQAGDQPDPTNVVPVRFSVVFSEPVSGFTAEDVTLVGTAPGTLVAVVHGSGTTYEVEVSGMTDTGTVTVSLAAGVVQTETGNPNQASTSTDSQITYTPWHNAANPCDLDGNGRVEALDVLTLINYINAHPGQTNLP